MGGTYDVKESVAFVARRRLAAAIMNGSVLQMDMVQMNMWKKKHAVASVEWASPSFAPTSHIIFR